MRANGRHLHLAANLNRLEARQVRPWPCALLARNRRVSRSPLQDLCEGCGEPGGTGAGSCTLIARTALGLPSHPHVRPPCGYVRGPQVTTTHRRSAGLHCVIIGRLLATEAEANAGKYHLTSTSAPWRRGPRHVRRPHPLQAYPQIPRRSISMRSRPRAPSSSHSIRSTRYPSNPRIRVRSRRDPTRPAVV